MNDAFNKNMQIITGKEQQSDKVKQLSEVDKKKVSKFYFKLFFNLAFTNWLRGKTLGQSWYTALNQLEQFVKSKNANNPAALYLRQVFAAHKTKWSQVIMTNKHREDMLQASPEQKQQWNQRVAKNVNEAMNNLNGTLKVYDLPEKEAGKEQSAQQDAVKLAAKQMQMLIMLRMKQNQRTRAA